MLSQGCDVIGHLLFVGFDALQQFELGIGALQVMLGKFDFLEFNL